MPSTKASSSPAREGFEGLERLAWLLPAVRDGLVAGRFSGADDAVSPERLAADRGGKARGLAIIVAQGDGCGFSARCEMVTNDDRKWEMIGAALSAESSGKSPRLFSSRRTLFGIPRRLTRRWPGSGRSWRRSRRRRRSRVRRTCDRCALFSRRTRAACGAPCGAPPRARVRPSVPRSPSGHDALSKISRGGLYLRATPKQVLEGAGGAVRRARAGTREEKERLLLGRGVALWDVLAECTIEGASDGTIADCVPNDIAWLMGKAPIEAVFCTGAKAAELYRRYCEPATRVSCVRLPRRVPRTRRCRSTLWWRRIVRFFRIARLATRCLMPRRCLHPAVTNREGSRMLWVVYAYGRGALPCPSI